MKLRILLAITAAGLALAGCDSARKALGLGKNAPDEFQVVTHAPLSMPPDFNLVPPKPGEPRPQEASSQQQAQTALLSNATTTSLDAPAAGGPSPGAQALLQ